MAKQRVLGRREFVRLSATATGAVALAACTQAPPAPPTVVPPTQPPAAAAPSAQASPQVTKAPEPTKPAAAASAQASPQVTAAPAPTKPAAATATPESRIGKHLIGKLEGPDVVTDPARFPKTFKEAPALAELVKAGKLPPVQERVSQDPLVIKPVHEIGKYGGTWRRGFTGPGDKWNGLRVAGFDNLLLFDWMGKTVQPHIAKSREFADGGRTLVIHLRRGMKWSDGQPFTADDFLFWYQDIYLNKDIVPTPTFFMTINGKPVTIEKVDTYTVHFRGPDPYYMLPEVMCSNNALGGAAQATTSGNWTGGFAPAHYLKQFLPKYASKDELDKKAKEARFDNWLNLFKARNDWTLNPELPVVTPWKTVTPINTPMWSFERNPYCVWVDTDGNQLPYIDKITMGLAENLEVVNLRAIAGEFDIQERHLDIQKLPVFLENQQKGNYKLKLDLSEFGYEAGLVFNLSYDADPEMAKWITNTDFRRALSLGIERDQLNETFWLGLGIPGSVVPADHNRYNPGPEWRTKWSTYDPKKANELLDKIGLDKKDADGYRLRGDGKGRMRLEVVTMGGQFMQYTQCAEMIKAQWKKIGVDADVREQERTLVERRAEANELQSTFRFFQGSAHLFAHDQTETLPMGARSFVGPLYGQWFASTGAKGKEPPANVRAALDRYRKAFGVPEEESVKLGKEIWQIIVDEQWIIGTVGISPAVEGVRIQKSNVVNVPDRLLVTNAYKSPGGTIPEHRFFK